MKKTIIAILQLQLITPTLPAAVPLRWTVETSRVDPAVFDAYQGETLTFEAALQSHGKPLAAPVNYSFFWQTNGMGSTYWEAPAQRGSGVSPLESGNVVSPLEGGSGVSPLESGSVVSPLERGSGVSPLEGETNVLFATWLPAYDVGARAYNCFIGSPSNIYHAAFQLRLRPSPGALPNALPLPTPVIDFARVRVLNPPWGSGGGGGCDTNAVDALANSAVVTNALTVATTNRVAALETATNNLSSSVSGLASSLADKANSADIPAMVKETMSAEGISSSYINIGGSISGHTIGDQYGDLREAINGKTDKVAPSNFGNLAALTADGNLADSGKTVDDFLPSEGDVSVDGNITSQSAINFIFFPRIGVNSSGDYAGIYVSSFSEIKIGSVEFPTGEEPDLQDALDLKADCSMISATNPTFSNAVATVARTVTPPPSPTLRLFDEVRQCYWIGRMINGVINWEVE